MVGDEMVDTFLEKKKKKKNLWNAGLKWRAIYLERFVQSVFAWC